MRVLSFVLLTLVALAGCDSNDLPTCADGVLTVEDVRVGTGQPARIGGSVTVGYIGTLEDGSVFENTANATFALTSGVIEGFRNGIGGTDDIAPMRIGGRRIITIPPNQAYGAAGRPGIPSCETLKFEVTLIDIN